MVQTAVSRASAQSSAAARSARDTESRLTARLTELERALSSAQLQCVSVCAREKARLTAECDKLTQENAVLSAESSQLHAAASQLTQTRTQLTAQQSAVQALKEQLIAAKAAAEKFQTEVCGVVMVGCGYVWFTSAHCFVYCDVM